MNEELKQALQDADWKEIIDWAKSQGYDPMKEDKVIKLRDSLMSQKAKAEYEADENKGLVEALKSKISEKEKAIADKETEYKSLVEKLGDNPDGIIEKLTKYEEAEAQRREKAKQEYEAERTAWRDALKITDEELAEVIPDLGDESKTLNWMKNNKTRLLGEKTSPVRVTEGTPVKDGDNLREQAERFVEKHGGEISIEAAERILKKQKEKNKVERT